MWLICCGARRSGSTVQTQMAAELITSHNKGVLPIQGLPEKYIRLRKNQNLQKKKGYKIFKTHYITPEIKQDLIAGNAIGIHCYRDPRDAYLSFLNKVEIRAENYDKALTSFFYRYLNYYHGWRPFFNKIYSSKYEDWVNSMEQELINLAYFLNINPSSKSIKKISDSLGLEKNKLRLNKGRDLDESYHHTHILQKNHINSGAINKWEDAFSSSLIFNMEAIVLDFLVEKGYKVTNQTLLKNQFISFSENFQDYFLFQLFDRKAGAFLEINAYNGVYNSSTAGLELNGWTGTCTEVGFNQYMELKKSRTNSDCYHIKGKSVFDDLRQYYGNPKKGKHRSLSMEMLRQDFQKGLELLVYNDNHLSLDKNELIELLRLDPKCILFNGPMESESSTFSLFKLVFKDYKFMKYSDASCLFFKNTSLNKSAESILLSSSWQSGCRKIDPTLAEKNNYKARIIKTQNS